MLRKMRSETDLPWVPRTQLQVRGVISGLLFQPGPAMVQDPGWLGLLEVSWAEVQALKHSDDKRHSY